jgi:hypothetical protein
VEFTSTKTKSHKPNEVYNRCTRVEGEYCRGQASKSGRQLKHMEGLGAISKKNE